MHPKSNMFRFGVPGIAALACVLALVASPSATAEPSATASPAAELPASKDACQVTDNNLPVGDCGPFKQTFAENFNGDTVPLGAFSDCDHAPDTRAAYCGGLSGDYRANWWAYPKGWEDTATSGADGNGGREIGGIYHPEDTVSVHPAEGVMRVRMFRPADGGPVHSSAVVPKAAMEQQYGKYSERFKVTSAAPGYKSAHLFYDSGFEIDYPEQNWDDSIHAFTHPGEYAKDTGAKFTEWHTTSIEWTPGTVKFYLDGELQGTATKDVPGIPMSWILQNESALYGEYAEPGSSATMDTTWVAVYSYKP
jgi:hypothetical protein